MSDGGKNNATRRKSARGSSRRRGAGSGLRKFANIESVVVEEPFSLLQPSSNSSNGTRALVASASSSNAQNEPSDAKKSGDGCYVSATVQNKRYYGVLIDQSSLKEASELWFHDEETSLNLNRRMKILKAQQLQKESPQVEQAQGGDDKEGLPVGLSSLDYAGSLTLHLNGEVNGTMANPNVLVPKDRSLEDSDSKRGELKRPAVDDPERVSAKRVKVGEEVEAVLSSNGTKPAAEQKESLPPPPPFEMTQPNRQVQKFRYVQQDAQNTGYRILLATFADVLTAANDDYSLARDIQRACDEGGQFVKDDYYQYEVLGTTLDARYETKSTKEHGIRTSMGFHSFLNNTALPDWFPLSNLQLGQQKKVWGMLNLKRGKRGNAAQTQNLSSTSTDILQPKVVPSSVNGGPMVDSVPSATNDDLLMITSGTDLPMKPRPKPRFQIGVIGGGIAGLSCCQELIRAMEKGSIDGQVTLMEARSRLGGRLWTDTTTFSTNPSPRTAADSTENSHQSEKPFPVDLGASWIHGIDHNPLAALAKEGNADFVSTSEQVQMFGANLQEVDANVDEEMGKLFDELLDRGADDCWSAQEESTTKDKNVQSAVRWYASVLEDFNANDASVFGQGMSTTETFQMKEQGKVPAKRRLRVEKTGAPPHRQSSDRSIDCEIAKAITKHKFREFSKLGAEEHRMLHFYTKNVEYALGANISDLSMKFWAADERHAFGGAHVLLRQGYSRVIQHMQNKLEAAGIDRFQCLMNFPAGKVEYARKSRTRQHLPVVSPLSAGFDQPKLIELSDTCAVTKMDGSETKYFDCLVIAVPLGVLKESIAKAESTTKVDKMEFVPPLPFSKTDAISHVGFGLLDKIYLQFPVAFWRLPAVFKEEEDFLFGNATGLNPHHYMFQDMGKALAQKDAKAPPILMSLFSGKEALACECKTDEELIDEVMSTLRAIFASEVSVPNPSAYRITRWGKDRYSRGSYTFLPPGATDQDFQVLKSPINGNGDSLLLEGSETMRLFFCGEHTTALHPSMAHGAMLSGIRAAKEVLSTLTLGCTARDSKDVDRLIPISLFRHNHANAPLKCSFCQKVGSQIQEGSLLAFKRGAKMLLAHDMCAQYSPEVDVRNGQWRNVVKAANRAKFLKCTLCHQIGAAVGCSADGCLRVFHYGCAEGSGFRFERDGKTFYCDLHRRSGTASECDRISIQFYLSKHHISALHCFFCGLAEENASTVGKLLAFQQVNTSGHNTLQFRQACVHERCAKYTNIVDTAELEESRVGHEYRRIFESLAKSKICTSCNRRGATVRCLEPSCNSHFHVPCCIKTGWNFEKRNGSHFKCVSHRNDRKIGTMTGGSNVATSAGFQHNLLAKFGATSTAPRVNIPSNLQFGSLKSGTVDEVDEEETSESEGSNSGEELVEAAILDRPLSHQVTGSKRLIRVDRKSREQCWKLALTVEERVESGEKHNVLIVASSGGGKYSLAPGDTVVSMNGMKVGTKDLKTLRLVLSRLKQEVDLMMEVVRAPS